MPSLYQNKKLWAIWLGLAVLIFFLGRSALSEFRRFRAIEAEVKERREEIGRAEEGIKELTAELEAVADPGQIEKEARRTLNLKREGEEVFVVVGLEAAERPEDFSGVFDETVEAEKGVWFNIKKWVNYFFTRSPDH